MNAQNVKMAVILSLLLVMMAPLSARAATPAEEARFVAAVQKAFRDHKPADLVELTCWDQVGEKSKKEAEGMYADLVEQKDVVWDFKLVDPEAKALEKERAKPVDERANIAVIKQLDMKFSDAKDGKRILGIIGFAVGEKDGKLLLARAPAK